MLQSLAVISLLCYLKGNWKLPSVSSIDCLLSVFAVLSLLTTRTFCVYRKYLLYFLCGGNISSCCCTWWRRRSLKGVVGGDQGHCGASPKGFLLWQNPFMITSYLGFNRLFLSLYLISYLFLWFLGLLRCSLFRDVAN